MPEGVWQALGPFALTPACGSCSLAAPVLCADMVGTGEAQSPGKPSRWVRSGQSVECTGYESGSAWASCCQPRAPPPLPSYCPLFCSCTTLLCPPHWALPVPQALLWVLGLRPAHPRASAGLRSSGQASALLNSAACPAPQHSQLTPIPSSASLVIHCFS